MGTVGVAGIEGSALEWTAWPAAERPAQAAAVASAVAAASLGLGAYGGDALLGVASLAVLFLSLSRYFLPTRYRIDEEGVEVASWMGRSRRPWHGLRSYAADARGVSLTPYARRSWLEAYRSLRLLYGRNSRGPIRRPEVLAAVAAHVAPRVR